MGRGDNSGSRVTLDDLFAARRAEPEPVLTTKVTLDRGLIVTEITDESGKLHNPDGPAKTKVFEETGALVTEEFYEHGKRHRRSSAALIQHVNYHPRSAELRRHNGYVLTRIETDYYEGALVSTGSSSFSERFYAVGPDDEEFLVRADRRSGIRRKLLPPDSSDGSPSTVSYNHHGVLIESSTCNGDGQLESIDGNPSLIKYNKDAETEEDKYVISERYHKSGNLHREGGEPAVISYDAEGYIIDTVFAEDGEIT